MTRDNLRLLVVDADKKAAGHPWAIDLQTRQLIHAVAELIVEDDAFADRVLSRMGTNADIHGTSDSGGPVG